MFNFFKKEKRNQIFLVLDSLRWDVFEASNATFLKSLGEWKKAYTQGTYTLPAHMSFFVGKLPQTLDNTDYYDTAAARFHYGIRKRNNNFWRLNNPETPRKSKMTLDGENIISGFKNLGYLTIGTGAVNWFNPELSAGKYLTESFDEFKFFDGPGHSSLKSSQDQINWVLDILKNNKEPYFLFMNFGETHANFVYKGCSWSDKISPYGNYDKCFERQKLCLEYLDKQIEKLLSGLNNYDLVICSDHGDTFGEDGLWGHGFCHPKVMEVPLLINLV